MQKLKLAGLLLATSLAAGCGFPGVYKIDVQQGNIVEKDSLDQLKIGLTRKQVHYLLGTPVLENTFDPSNETYIYTIQLAGGIIQKQNIMLVYDNAILKKIDKKAVLPPKLANPAKTYADRKELEALRKELEAL